MAFQRVSRRHAPIAACHAVRGPRAGPAAKRPGPQFRDASGETTCFTTRFCSQRSGTSAETWGTEYTAFLRSPLPSSSISP